MFNFIATPVFIPSWTSFHSDLLFFICSHSHFKRRADNVEVLFEVKKKKDMSDRIHPSWLQQTLSPYPRWWSPGRCSSSSDKLACLFQQPSQREMQHAYFLKLYQVNADPGFCWVLQNTTLFFKKHWDLLSALTHNFGTGTDATESTLSSVDTNWFQDQRSWKCSQRA